MPMKNTVIDYFPFAGLNVQFSPPPPAGEAPSQRGLRGERTFYGKPAGDNR